MMPLIATIGFSCGCAERSGSPGLHAFGGSTMGTTFTVKVASPAAGVSGLEKEIDAAFAKINRELSTYLEDSDLSRFNRHRGTDWFPISDDCVRVFEKALEISRASGGAFDVTVGPLVNLWGFGPEERDRAMPSDREIRERMAAVGYEKIAVRLSPAAARKSVPGVYCDLSAIAKGFAVDKVAELLEARGLENFMVEIGGEVRAKGKNDLGGPWRIGVEQPDAKPGMVRTIVRISGYSMATSGDYRNYFEHDGIRYSHTIDPRSGRPVTHKLASVTVIHRSSMVADGMATAINVLGPEAGYEFAVQQGLPALMIVRDAGGFADRMTPGFEPFLR